MSIASKDGKVDSAVVGSPKMIDEKRLLLHLVAIEPFANLQNNPNAVYLMNDSLMGVDP